jgi:hypothetical protein
MRMTELVEVYESTRRTAAVTGTRRLRRWARSVRRALDHDRRGEVHQVRLAAIENELLQRGGTGPRAVPLRRAQGPSTRTARGGRAVATER